MKIQWISKSRTPRRGGPLDQRGVHSLNMNLALARANLNIRLFNLNFRYMDHKQASRHTHARAQCSHASVGLAQARPNN